VSSDFVVTCESTDTGATIEFAGDLDATTAPGALAAIQDLELRQGQQLVVNLAALTFCDSSGIATLIAARNLAMAAQAVIVLAAVPHQLASILALVGLGGFFPVYATVAEAHAALAG
jgi:anti-anti-sigma factor